MIPNRLEALAAGVREHVLYAGEHPDVHITYTGRVMAQSWRVRFAVSAAPARRGKGHRRWQWRTVTGKTLAEALANARAMQVELMTGGTLPHAPGEIEAAP